MAELTDLFDYLVLGTDTSASILAAALARASCKVIHLDAPSYFGSTDSSLNFTELVGFYAAPDTVNCSNKTVQVQAVSPT
jgi:RAB protein geranylgeranyltransferase component A